MNIWVYSISNKMIGEHDSDFNGMIDTWTDMMVSLEDFKSNIHDIGLPYAKKNKLTTWIVDTSRAKNAFKKEVQDFIETTVAPKCSEIGILYFFVVLPTAALARISAKNVAKINAGQKGMQTIQVGRVEAVHELLAKQRS